MNSYLLHRDLAELRSSNFRKSQTARLLHSLQRSSIKSLKKRHFAAVNVLDIEQINER